MSTSLLDISLFFPVILQIGLFVALLYLPLPIVLWIYKRRRGQKPSDFQAEGTFQGFKITTQGSVALYFILLLACISASIPIMKSIDQTQIANQKIAKITYELDSLLDKEPWKLSYSIRLMTDSLHEIKSEVYSSFLNDNRFHSFPPALDLDPSTHIISCYIDVAVLQSNGNNYTLNIDSFSAGMQIHIDKNQKDSLYKTINLGVKTLYYVPLSLAPYSYTVNSPKALQGKKGITRSDLPNDPK